MAEHTPRSDHPAAATSDEPRVERSRLSMHEDVDTWCDCCSCEPEPRWQRVGDELEREGEGAERDLTFPEPPDGR